MRASDGPCEAAGSDTAPSGAPAVSGRSCAGSRRSRAGRTGAAGRRRPADEARPAFPWKSSGSPPDHPWSRRARTSCVIGLQNRGSGAAMSVTHADHSALARAISHAGRAAVTSGSPASHPSCCCRQFGSGRAAWTPSRSGTIVEPRPDDGRPRLRTSVPFRREQTASGAPTEARLRPLGPVSDSSPSRRQFVHQRRASDLADNSCRNLVHFGERIKPNRDFLGRFTAISS